MVTNKALLSRFCVQIVIHLSITKVIKIEKKIFSFLSDEENPLERVEGACTYLQ